MCYTGMHDKRMDSVSVWLIFLPNKIEKAE